MKKLFSLSVLFPLVILAFVIGFICYPVGAQAGVSPPNDDCANTIPIFDGDTAFDTTEATTDGPTHIECQFDGQTYEDIWYTYTATCTGDLTVSTCNQATYDTDLVIYDGTSCAALLANFLECNDDFAGCSDFTSELMAPVVTGQDYLIRVGGFALGDEGSGTLSINCAVPTGACCLPDGSCSELTEADCSGSGGAYQGDGTICDASIDCDLDGVLDGADACLGTVIPEATVPSSGELKPNRYALLYFDTTFDRGETPGNSNRPARDFTIQDTCGCSCEQIIAEQGLDGGQEKFGCSPSVMEEWSESCSPACPCFDASNIQGQGIDFMAQVLPDANCIDLLPNAIQLDGTRDGSGTTQVWTANAVFAPILPDNQCFLVDALFGVNNTIAPITDAEVLACIDILLASQMFLLNNCPP